ncbi:helix-turn-helix domain-containing protein [Nucisporomicrobium flavum]|uniref:helix-turn-helix domain-containing protein n=1 Tax=Nucisporomicrobium flavum TaxID=2785915 RepID=UPI0018F49448|nr:helix-turn-helix transcriptional regulator [Nucisporomicrobium flavum]
MAASDPRAELGRRLTRLKEHAGLSYQALGSRTHLSKSAIHRYCAGSCTPADFGTVERIGRATGASRPELEGLFVLWSRAVACTETAHAPDAKPGDTGVGQARPLWQRPRRASAVVGLTMVLGVLVILNGLRGGNDPDQPAGAPAAQWVSGPTWTLPAEPVPATLFGVTINSATGHMPAFTVGAVRLWDSGTLWATLQPEPGRFDWTTLDRQVKGAESASLPVLFVLGGTPGWAAPAGPRAPYPEDARAAPPDDPARWDAFVSALVHRYAGRIEAYELWVLATDRHFYSGSVETLVDMTRRADRIIERADPHATVVCPGMGNLWTDEGRQTLRRFAELGGYDHCDVAGIKLHQRSAADPPETMLQLTDAVDGILHAAGVHPRIWNTGTTYTIPLQGRLDEAAAVNHAVRFYLVGLLARNIFLERMYLYNWGGAKVPIVLQVDGGSPTPAARAVETLQRWLAGARVSSCGHGPAIDLPPNAWQCRFTLAARKDPGAGTHRTRATILWTHEGTASFTAAADMVSVERLDGTSAPVAGGSPLSIGEEPVLVRYRS